MNNKKTTTEQTRPFLTTAKAEVMAAIEEYVPEGDIPNVREVKRELWLVIEPLLKANYYNGLKGKEKARR